MPPLSDYYLISIPVKPHIKKFITSKEGDPVNPQKSSMTWLVIRPYLFYKTNDTLPLHKKEKLLHNLSDRIYIKLALSQQKNYGRFIRPSSAIFINRYLNYLFGKELYWHVMATDMKEGRYKGYNTALISFCEKHDIIVYEDISLDALQKLFFRHCRYDKKSGATNDVPAKKIMRIIKSA